MKKPLLFSLLLLFVACRSTKAPFYDIKVKDWKNTTLPTNNESIHTLYLLGNTGDHVNISTNNPVYQHLEKQLNAENKNATVVFLGDQVSPNGMPKKKAPLRASAEAVLKQQLELVRDFPGKTVFLAGDKDWNGTNAKGRKAVRRQEKFVEGYFEDDKKVKFQPGKACGEPDEDKITKDLVFVYIDSQWWLQNWDNEKDMNNGCDVRTRHDFLKEVEILLSEHKNDEVVIMMHHPIISNGKHGGYFSVGEQMKPLPILGSAKALYRKAAGTRQDIANFRYQDLTNGIVSIIKKFKMNAVFAGAHDNSLQYFDDDKIKYIVSGSSTKATHAAPGNDADFVVQRQGYSVIRFYKNFEAYVEFYALNPTTKQVELAFRKQIRAPRPGTVEDGKIFPTITEKDTILPANANFAAGPIKKLFLGSQYREMWSTPVKTSTIDLETKYGGLTPIKKGGGMASNSLRMELDNGKQYILRSINKDYRKLVPSEWGNLKMIDIFKDQNSASHPYGALAIPKLSQEAGVYYTHPRLTYLKHQRGLKEYNELFPEELYLLEERPSGNWSDAEQFGNSAEIIGYTDLLNILREKKNHFVDQEWTLKSRLFDMVIHDWDRHDDQWRWASFKEDGKTTYRPIPRDRDQAFYRFKGIVPWYVAMFLQKKFKTMKGDVRDVKNLNFNGKHFDRFFLNQLEWKDWQQIVEKLQKDLSDEDIATAFLEIPEEVREFNNEETIRLVTERRNNLLKIAKKYYKVLAKEVEIVGTDDDNRFEIDRKENGNVTIKYYVSKDGTDILKYDRTFYPSETKEIRIYGLRGKDEFIVTGSDVAKIRIRIIGGEEQDIVDNKTNGGKLFAYDNIDGIELKGKKIKDKTSLDLEVNEYDRNEFQYGTSFPILTFGSTQDEGFWFGASMTWTNQGWRRSPYKSQNSAYFRVAPGTRNAFHGGYSGHFPNVIGDLGFAPSFDIKFPHYQNYFGLGNNTVNLDTTRAFNWVRMQSIDVSPLFQITTKSQTTTFKFGPVFQSHDIDNVEGRVSDVEPLEFPESEFNRRNYLGGTFMMNSSLLDDNVIRGNGFGLQASATYLTNLGDEDNDVFEIKTGLQVYLTLVRRPQIIFASGVGYSKVWGNPQFFQYPALGTTSNLRGYRNERFRGESLFYNNNDIRFYLFKWNNSILPMTVGIMGGYDIGRVWVDNENTDKWHDSQSVGLLLNVMGLAIIQPYYSFTPEGNVFSLKVGYYF